MAARGEIEMIKKIYFENFKSFARTEIQIENITTLIGTNSSGKSNMIEGMMILSELTTGRDLSVRMKNIKMKHQPYIKSGYGVLILI